MKIITHVHNIFPKWYILQSHHEVWCYMWNAIHMHIIVLVPTTTIFEICTLLICVRRKWGWGHPVELLISKGSSRKKNKEYDFSPLMIVKVIGNMLVHHAYTIVTNIVPLYLLYKNVPLTCIMGLENLKAWF